MENYDEKYTIQEQLDAEVQAQDIAAEIELIENMNEETILNFVTAGLQYEMVKDVLVKPLEVIKVKKLVNTPVETEEVDEDGNKLMDMEVKEVEVDSAFRSGIILSLPTGANYDETLKVGMKIVYPFKYSIDFDLFKDSVLVKPYDIIAKVKS